MKFNLWLKALLCTDVFAVGGLDHTSETGTSFALGLPLTVKG